MKKFLLGLMSITFILPAFANTNPTKATAQYLKSIENNPPKLEQFFYAMPKGGDIHNHIDGAVYAEDLIRFGSNENFCINPKTMTAYVNPNCDKQYQFKNLSQNPTLYRQVIDAWSMRYFPLNSKPGLPHFFSTFLKMEPVLLKNVPNAIASIANRAGRQNEIYLELMIGSSELMVKDAKGQLPVQVGQATTPDKNLNVWREALLKNGLTTIVNKTKIKIENIHKQVQNLMHCGTDKALPGCKVTIRYQYFTRRILPPKEYYAQIVTAFAVANSSPLIVAVNIVMPENWKASLKYYTTQMEMIGFLRKVYPKAHVTLHAGELAFGQVMPKYLTYHVSQAINIAHAQRIGHGVDIPFEKNSQALLNEMAKKHIDIEVNLTSNHDVLDVYGKNHPLPLFIQSHVPVTLSTDDEGIERTDLTQQYVIAEHSYHIPYETLKNMVRNNLTYGFVQGKSLWQGYNYQKPVSACAGQSLGNANPSASCKAFLKQNLKAKLQWQLESEFNIFEQQYKY